MGRLFAVSNGLPERSRKALLRVLPFAALGHVAANARPRWPRTSV